jgi:predicted peptidase
MARHLIRGLCAAALLAACAAVTPADDAKHGFVNKTFKNADGSESPYVVFVPHDYDGKKEYPVILFLHGAGETKSTSGKGKMPVEVGIGPAIKKQEKTFPFIVVIPQAEAAGRGVLGRWGAGSPDGKRALAMLDEVMKEYKADPKRVYLTGLSMGGFGTWSLVEAHPDRWAAIVPICGGVGSRPNQATDDRAKEAAAKIKDIPCWCFHGDQDSSVSVAFSRTMIKALKEAGGDPKYTEYPGVGHNSWDKAYGTAELWTWLLEQKKK